MTAMESGYRWNLAQTYEKGYWKNLADSIVKGSVKQLSWYGWKASEFEKKMLDMIIDIPKDKCKVLEIGSGPIGIVSYMDWGEKYAVDPLNDYYKDVPSLVSLRNPNVSYITGKGEELRFPDQHFQIVIIDNVLDHVLNPSMVLDEIHRVLCGGGYLYIELNIHTRWGCALHSTLAKLKIDKGHPHSFTEQKIRTLLSKKGLSIEKEFISNYISARNADRKSESLKPKIKGFCGLSEFIYGAICKKNNERIY